MLIIIWFGKVTEFTFINISIHLKENSTSDSYQQLEDYVYSEMNKDSVGAIYEANLAYPRKLHNLHRTLHLTPEHIQYKRSATLNNKINYAVYYKHLQSY